MDTKDLIKATQSTQKLIQDDTYYKYIFKKTERIVSVVFYITQSLEQKDKYTRTIQEIEDSAQRLHNVVLESLNVRAHVAEENIQGVTHALVTLESKLRVAHVMRVITREVLEVIDNEVDSVLRALVKYSNEDNLYAERTAAPQPPAPAVSLRSAAATPIRSRATTPAAGTTEGMQSRRTRILTIIEAKGEVSIKDITDIITDVSEKTIQRELNAMIEDNQIKRIGERRWSKYTLF